MEDPSEVLAVGESVHCKVISVEVFILLETWFCRSATLKVHPHERQRLRVRVRLRQDDNIASMSMLHQNAKNGWRTHSLCLMQRSHKHVAIWHKCTRRRKRWRSCEWTLTRRGSVLFRPVIQLSLRGGSWTLLSEVRVSRVSLSSEIQWIIKISVFPMSHRSVVAHRESNYPLYSKIPFRNLYVQTSKNNTGCS